MSDGSARPRSSKFCARASQRWSQLAILASSALVACDTSFGPDWHEPGAQRDSGADTLDAGKPDADTLDVAAPPSDADLPGNADSDVSVLPLRVDCSALSRDASLDSGCQTDCSAACSARCGDAATCADAEAWLSCQQCDLPPPTL